MRHNKYPIIGEITMVIPTKITDLGVYVQLVEYNNIEGMIMLSDLSKSRYRSINKVVSIGKKIAAIIQNIDEDKNIVLSKKDVSDKEAKICENNYKTLKYVYDLMNLFVRKMQKDNGIVLDIDNMYQIFIWSISHDLDQIMNGLKTASKDWNKVYKDKLENIDPLWISCFQQILSLKFKEKDVILEAILDITCFETAGVNIIKSVLMNASKMATNEFPFKIKLVKSPFYSITIKTNDQENASNMITNVIETIKLELVKNNSNIKIVKLPEIVLDKEFEPEKSDSETDEDIVDIQDIEDIEDINK